MHVPVLAAGAGSTFLLLAQALPVRIIGAASGWTPVLILCPAGRCLVTQNHIGGEGILSAGDIHPSSMGQLLNPA